MNIKEELLQYLKELYEVVNLGVNPLPVIPSTDKSLYCVKTGVTAIYFNTKEEQEDWIIKNKPKICNRYRVEYLGRFAGKEIVFNEINDNDDYRLIAVGDKDGYYVYNTEKSNYKGVRVWDYYYKHENCSVARMIDAFEKAGILEKDNSKVKTMVM